MTDANHNQPPPRIIIHEPALRARPDDTRDPEHIHDPEDVVDQSVDAAAIVLPKFARSIFEVRQFAYDGELPIELTAYNNMQTEQIEQLVGSATFTGSFGLMRKSETYVCPPELLTDCNTLHEAFARLEEWYGRVRFERESKLSAELHTAAKQLEAMAREAEAEARRRRG